MDKPWSRKYPEIRSCVICGKTDYIHWSKGRCKLCVWRLKAQKEKERRAVDPNYREKYLERVREKAKENRRENLSVRLKERELCRSWYRKHKKERSEYRKAYYFRTANERRLWARHTRLGLSVSELQEILKESGYKCDFCGQSQEETRLDIHHIDGQGMYVSPEKRNNSKENLMVLCIACHTSFDHLRRKSPEDYWDLIKKLKGKLK